VAEGEEGLAMGFQLAALHGSVERVAQPIAETAPEANPAARCTRHPRKRGAKSPNFLDGCHTPRRGDGPPGHGSATMGYPIVAPRRSRDLRLRNYGRSEPVRMQRGFTHLWIPIHAKNFVPPVDSWLALRK